MTLGFVIMVYKDEVLAIRLVRQILKYYPQSKVTVIWEGGVTEYSGEWYSLQQRMSIRLIFGERLKVLATGPEWVKRWMQAGLEMNTQLVFRVDPDVYLWRPFRYFPTEDRFGMMLGQLKYKRPLLRGCIGGYQREAIQKFLDSNILDDPKWKDPVKYAYYRYREWARPGEKQNHELIWSEDSSLAHAWTEAGLTEGNWSDIHPSWHEPLIDNSDLAFAATHPVLDPNL